MRWVNDFVRYCKDIPGLSVPGKQIDPFLTQIGKKYEYWQVKQAKDAVCLYCYFISRKDAQHGENDNKGIADWKSAGENMVRMLRLKQRAYRTEQTYMKYLRDFYIFIKPTVPEDLNGSHLIEYLSYLAVERKVAKSTQDVAFNSLLFFYRFVLEKDVGSINNVVRSKPKQRLPTVLSREESKRLIDGMTGVAKLMAGIAYGGGLRSNECYRLRVMDLDFERLTITVRSGKGDKDRQTMLPESIVDDLKEHLKGVRELYKQDRKNDIAGVYLPDALDKKYPNAPKEWKWFWVFPSYKLSIDPHSNIVRRHHVSPYTFQKGVNRAAKVLDLRKKASPHTFRHYVESDIMGRIPA